MCLFLSPYLFHRFAFNCGSTESIAGKANHAAVGRIALTMSLAAASGGLTQAIISALVQLYKRDENYNTNEIANAILASLVAVTGCCVFMEPPFAVLIGGWREEEEKRERERKRVKNERNLMLKSYAISNLIFLVLTTFIYHIGCFIEYAMRLHDGARVFPVHGMW